MFLFRSRANRSFVHSTAHTSSANQCKFQYEYECLAMLRFDYCLNGMSHSCLSVYVQCMWYIVLYYIRTIYTSRVWDSNSEKRRVNEEVFFFTIPKSFGKCFRLCSTRWSLSMCERISSSNSSYTWICRPMLSAVIRLSFACWLALSFSLVFFTSSSSFYTSCAVCFHRLRLCLFLSSCASLCISRRIEPYIHTAPWDVYIVYAWAWVQCICAVLCALSSYNF